MRIAVLSETDPIETRVAATPETVKKYKALGAEVAVQAGAGAKAGVPDAEFEAAGATIAAGAAEAATRRRRRAQGAPAGRRRARRAEARRARRRDHGPLRQRGRDPQAMADAGVAAFAMELMPRITRAQVMDVLSSQANLAGYRAVIDGAAEYGRAFPMMMTAAGTVPAARIFIMGVGVAGLQAIATARRLGAVVTATDVRPAAKEQVESLGAKFVAVEDEEFKQAETAAGYAKEMSKEYQAKQAELVASHIAKQDIVITTALIPGRPAPKLVSAAMVAIDAAGLGHRRPRGRARRQRRTGESRRDGDDAERRQDRRPPQRAGPARRLVLGALRPQPLRLRRDPGRQGDEGARGEVGRRARRARPA